MKYRKFKKSDIRQVAEIKNSVFVHFNGTEWFEKRAVSKYLRYTDPKKTDRELLDAFKVYKDTIFIIAEEKGKIIGYIKGRKDRISNLFVLGKSHKKGIGRKLVYLFENAAKKQNSREVKIRSSIYASPFYQKVGYKKTTGIRNFHGLKVQPMKKTLK